MDYTISAKVAIISQSNIFSIYLFLLVRWIGARNTSVNKFWKTLSRVRVCVRALQEFSSFCCHKCHSLHFAPLFFPLQPRCFTTSKTTRRSKRNNTSLFQNDTLFEVKRHVTFHKTTRRFMWNECLFSWCVDSFFDDIRILSKLYSDKNRRFP